MNEFNSFMRNKIFWTICSVLCLKVYLMFHASNATLKREKNVSVNSFHFNFSLNEFSFKKGFILVYN